MNRLKSLLPASFKGIAFYVRSESLTEGGRRVVLHDFPNSSQRYVEDLGQLPPKFNVTAFVTGPDFLNRSDQLKRALQEKGPGKLILPTLGSLIAFALPYNMDASQADVGEIRFNLSFASGRTISGPIRAPISVEKVYSSGDQARAAIGNALENKWIAPKETPNVITAIYDLKKCAESTEQLLRSVNNAAEQQAVIDFIGFNAPSIVRSAAYIRQIFVDRLWQNISTGLSGGAGLANVLGLTKYGASLSLILSDIKSARVSEGMSTSTTIPTWPETTASRTIRNRNRLTLVNAHRVNALVTAYEQAADKTYQTDGELDAARYLLETEHERLLRDDTTDRDLPQSQAEVRQAVEDTRLACLDVLDQKEQTTFALANLYLSVPIPAYVLAYGLYAESLASTDQLHERALVLRNLNPAMPADKLNGNIMVLQQ